MAVHFKEGALGSYLPQGISDLQNICSNSGVKCHRKALTKEQCSIRLEREPQFLKIESPGHSSACWSNTDSVGPLMIPLEYKEVIENA